jgi:FkbM family methyltransferase
LFQEAGVDIVLDVGANVGQFASDLRLSYRKDIISFEPTVKQFEQLSRSSAGDRRWSAHKIALGRQSGFADINVSSSSVFSSFLKPNQYAAQRFGNQTETQAVERVEVSRLDEFLPRVLADWRTRNIFLKMDTQGFDLDVFEGASGVLDRIVGLQSEVSVKSIYEGMTHWTQSIRHYESKGYVVAGLFPVSMDGISVVEFDCLMVRDKIASRAAAG